MSEPTKLSSKSDDVNILTLKKSKKLRSKVKKELKNTGLIDSDECRSLSSDESVGSDTSVQSDSKTRGSAKKGTSKSKPKKNKQSDSSVESPETISKRKTKEFLKENKRRISKETVLQSHLTAYLSVHQNPILMKRRSVKRR